MIEFLGNKDLLSRSKTAFLCSRNVSSASVLRCYDWATEMRKENQVIISGFQSKIEKDVLHFLLKGHQPVIIVIARQMYKQLPEEWQSPMSNGDLLIVSIAPKAIRTSTKKQLIIEIATLQALLIQLYLDLFQKAVLFNYYMIATDKNPSY